MPRGLRSEAERSLCGGGGGADPLVPRRQARPPRPPAVFNTTVQFENYICIQDNKKLYFLERPVTCAFRCCRVELWKTWDREEPRQARPFCPGVRFSPQRGPGAEEGVLEACPEEASAIRASDRRPVRRFLPTNSAGPCALGPSRRMVQQRLDQQPLSSPAAWADSTCPARYGAAVKVT